ncbi:hypothetical protein EOI86_09105 [Hwanghaeella grinnelliae]|uniref:Uncharacterized protein n=1 Tax=Hwanghaeella grinnelliae TaxID=2500179 RepID=A0A3S2VTE0_9PROT|nr:hypothetical protein [Hwanghaeella grinnelliae]RVU39379.1 hypothetical protein EOI86_09105 [Hwanghaeella grinnelliae]
MTSIADVFHSDQNLIAYRIARTDCYPVTILSDAETPKNVSIQDFAFLLQSSSYVKIDGIGIVQTDQPGLYRVYRLSDAACVQWIVYDDDLITFAASVAAVFYHAANEPAELMTNDWNSRRKLHEYFLNHAITGKVGGVCITAANSFAQLCREIGLDAVLWEFQDVGTEYNPVRSHVMSEVRDSATGKRLLVDIDRKYILQNDRSQPLSCLEYVEYSVNNQPYDVVPISKAKVAGFGPTARIPKVLDFEEELFELTDDAYREEIVRSIGKSLLIKGTRYYGANDIFTLPGLPDRIKDFLSSNAAAAISGTERMFLESVQQYPEADF